MDDAIGLYLVEMKEENDRLIKELQQTKEKGIVSQVTKPLPSVEKKAPITVQPEQATTISQNGQVSLTTEEVTGLEVRQYIPKAMVTNAYSKQKAQSPEEVPQAESEQNKQLSIAEEVVEDTIPKKQTYEEQVISYHKAGMSVENIAKTMQRGKTEIELLIKFHA